MSDNIDNLGPVSIEWVIDNQQIFADLAKTQEGFAQTGAAVDSVTSNIKSMQAEAQAAAAAMQIQIESLKSELKTLQLRFGANTFPDESAKMALRINDLKQKISDLRHAQEDLVTPISQANGFNTQVEQQIGLIAQLQSKLKELNVQKLSATTPAELSSINMAIQETEIELSRMSNMGKKGFDEFGDATKGFGKSLSTGYNWLRKIAYILPGIGIAGIIAFAFGPLVTWVKNLIAANTALDATIEKQNALASALNSTEYKNGISNVEKLKSDLELAKEGFIDKDGVIDEYNKLIGKVAGNVDTLNQAEQGLIDHADDFIRITLLKAAAQVVLSDSAKEAAATAIKNQQIADEQAALQQKLAEYNAIKGTQIISGTGVDQNAGIEAQKTKLSAQIVDLQKQIEDNNKTLKSDLDKRLQIVTNFGKEQADLYKKMGQSESTGISDIAKVRNKLSDDALQAQKTAAQTIINDQNQSFAKRLKAINDFYAASKQLAKNNENLALSDKKLSADQKLHIENQYNNAVLAARKEREQQINTLSNKEGATSNRAANLIAEQTRVLGQIDALKAKYASKQETRDQQQADAIKAAYQAQVNNIDALNAKYDAFVKKYGQAAATAAGLQRINPNQLQGSETNALAALAGTQSLEQTKVQISQQKQLWQEYEQFRLKNGETAANALYGNELQGYKSFLQYLRGLQPTEAQLTSADPYVKARATALQDYLKTALPQAENQEMQQNARLLQGLISQTKTAASERQAAEDQYQQNVLTLVMHYQGADLADRLANLKNYHDKAIDDTKTLAFQQSKIFRDASENTFNMSADQLQSHIKEFQKEIATGLKVTPEQQRQIMNGLNFASLLAPMGDSFYSTLETEIVKALNLTPEQKKQLESQLQQLKSQAGIDQYGQNVDYSNSTSKKWQQIAAYADSISSDFSNLASSFQDINPGLADTLNTMSQLASVGGDAAKSIASFAAGDVVSGIASAISAIGGIFSIFGAAKRSAEQAAAQLKQWQDQLIIGQMAYNELLRQQADTQQNINSLNAEQLQQQEQTLKSNLSGAQSDYNQLLAQIQGQGQQVTGEHTQKYGGFLGIGRKTKVVQEMAGLNGETYDQLLKLSSEKKLDSTTQAWFDQLQKVHDEIGTINDSLSQTQDQEKQIFTGTTASDLGNAILQGLEQGKRGFASFQQDFTTMMQTALNSTFSDAFLQPLMDQFYATFAADAKSGGGLSPEEITQLRTLYSTDITTAGKEYDQLFKALGIPTPSQSGSASSSSLSGQITGITEPQANALEGLLQGVQLASIQSNDI